MEHTPTRRWLLECIGNAAEKTELRLHAAEIITIMVQTCDGALPMWKSSVTRLTLLSRRSRSVCQERRLGLAPPDSGGKRVPSPWVGELITCCRPSEKPIREIARRRSSWRISLMPSAPFCATQRQKTASWKWRAWSCFYSCSSALTDVANEHAFVSAHYANARSQNKSRFGAMKALAFALQPPDSGRLCARFVEHMGIRLLFPYFMKVCHSMRVWLSLSDAHVYNRAQRRIASLKVSGSIRMRLCSCVGAAQSTCAPLLLPCCWSCAGWIERA
jgi:hypothetical protein